MAEIKKKFHETVAEKLIEQLKKGTAPWQKPWQAGEPGTLLPTNPTTGKRYKGINAIQLLSLGHVDQRWMTYKQAFAVGARVRKGEQGTSVQYWKFAKKHSETEALSAEQSVTLARPRVFFATVFNAAQIDGLPVTGAGREREWNGVERAEKILQACGALLYHGGQNRAFYRPATDSIHLPEKAQFPSAQQYYATALHELGHATGHASRLARDLAHVFGSAGYAREELRAEIASMILGDELGIGHDPAQHAAYVGAWIVALQDDPLEIFRAAADAEKIRDYVLGLEPKQVQELGAVSAPAQDQIDARSVAGARARHGSTGAISGALGPAHADDACCGAVPGRAPDAPMGPPHQDAERAFIEVPFRQRKEARALGAKWDRRQQSWYVPPGAELSSFAKWTDDAAKIMAGARHGAQAAEGAAAPAPVQERDDLAVPHGEIVAAMAAGAQWDKAARSWYAGPKADMAKLRRWKRDGMPRPATTPREEFAEALRSLGCVVGGEHPIMDGHKHRVTVEGEKHSEKSGSGFYVGHLDGCPAGYIKNNKTGIDMKWRSKGDFLGPLPKAQRQAEAAAQQLARQGVLALLQKQAAYRVGRHMAHLVPALQATPYMRLKGIEPQAGVFTDKEGRKTHIPAIDVDGQQWTLQCIGEDGSKRFARDSRKEGCFHAVGGMQALVRAPALVIAEGYATASSLSQALGFATVVAFDAGNLPRVAKALHEKFPDKPVIIAGDDDRHLEMTQGVNPGKSKAQEAATATGGTLLLPIFARGEQAANPKSFTDFNDLATKSALGKEGIKRQVCSIVEAAIWKHRARR